MALQVLVTEFVGYSALFLRTIEGKPTCPQYHKLDPYESCLVLRILVLVLVLTRTKGSLIRLSVPLLVLAGTINMPVALSAADHVLKF